MESVVLASYILGILGFLVILIFFWYYGGFGFPWYCSLSLLLTLSIALVQTVCLLPIDASNSLFGSKIHDKKIGEALIALYWTSMIMGWFLTPLLTSLYTYRYGLTRKARFMYALKYNVKWYLWAGLLVIIGIIVMVFTKGMKFSDLIPLVMALSNAYSLLLLCLLLGYGFISLPRSLWKFADIDVLKSFYYHRIHDEFDDLVQSVVNAKEVLRIGQNSVNQVKELHRDQYNECINPRILFLESVIAKETFLENKHLDKATPERFIEKYSNAKWNQFIDNDLEDFLEVFDSATANLNHSVSFFIDSIENAENCIKNTAVPSCWIGFRLVFMRCFSIIIGIICLISFWGEMVMMYKPSWSVFYILSHLKMSPLYGQLFVTSPIVLFLIYVGSWSLTKVKIGNYFRFIKGASSDNTFYFFIVLLGRLAPTIGYHYLLQVGGYNSQTIKIWFPSTQVAFFGSFWPLYIPILMLLVGVFVYFDVWDQILNFFGLKIFTFDESIRKYDDYNQGRKILNEIRPSTASMLQPMEDLSIDNPLINKYNW